MPGTVLYLQKLSILWWLVKRRPPLLKRGGLDKDPATLQAHLDLGGGESAEESVSLSSSMSYQMFADPLLDECRERAAQKETRRWKAAAAAGGLLAAGGAATIIALVQERSALKAQVTAHEVRSNFVISKSTALVQKKKASMCTAAGKDVFENPTGDKLPCCDGLVQTTGKCRGNDVCHFCIPSTLEDGPRTEYPPAKISIDPATPKSVVDKYKDKGMSLIWSDEFKDLQRTKSMFVFEDIPYGVPGNTGDVNIASIYASDTVSLIPGGGLRLSSFMDPADEKEFMKVPCRVPRVAWLPRPLHLRARLALLTHPAQHCGTRLVATAVIDSHPHRAGTALGTPTGAPTSQSGLGA